MSENENIDNGGPAFPHPNGANDATVQVSYLGMSLRDWFAGNALANQYAQHEGDPNKVAEWAFHIADAMIATRKAGAE